MIQVIPIVVFQFLGVKIDPRNLVRRVIRCLESIAIVDIASWIRMPRSISSHGDGGAFENDFVEDASDGQ